MNLFLLFVALNFFVGLTFALDKMFSRVRCRRVPEAVLLTFCVLCPLGGHFGMHTFQHKTLKLRFIAAVAVGFLFQVTGFFALWPYFSRIFSS